MKELKEKVIAVVGVSEREEKFGFKIFRDLLKAGFVVVGVNPRGGEVLGQKVFANLKDIGKIPDLVITVVSPAVTEKIIEECKELGVKEVWMQPGSDSESAIKKAREYGIKVTYNACFMVHQGIW
jgi:predicted CoA-binding protein